MTEPTGPEAPSGELEPTQVLRAPAPEVTTPDLAVLAAMVGRQSSDLSVYANFLANSLAGALPPEFVTVTRERGRFGRTKPDGAVLSVALRLGERTYGLVRPRAGAAITPTVIHEVGGVVLSTKTIALDEWSRSVAAGLAALTESNADAAAALSRMTRFIV
jgi:hypothetical protein